MKEIKILTTKYGFCYGVTRSIKLVTDVLNDSKYPRPIYLLNSIVHNKYVNDYFLEKGIILLNKDEKLNLLSNIHSGTIIFSAHGVSDVIRQKAIENNLSIVDATCPFVEKSYNLIKKYIHDDYHIIYIGKKNHPETEAVLSFSTQISLINDFNQKLIFQDRVAVAHQTTMSDFDVKEIYDFLLLENPHLKILPMICEATSKRQKELYDLLNSKDLINTLVIIVGDKKSNNCTKLYELASRFTSNVIFIANYTSLINIDLTKYDKFIVSAGTSTPRINVENVINFLKNNRIIVEKLEEYIE